MRGVRGLLLLGCLPLLAATVGCKEYKYFDVHVKFDAATFDPTKIFRVHDCRVTVSGADSDTFVMRNTCPNHTGTGNAADGGSFEFSTFADSGTLKFTVDAFEGLGDQPQCLLGSGNTSISVTAMMTIMGEVNITSDASTNGCPNGGGSVNPDGG